MTFIDTHVLLWLALEPTKLSKNAATEIQRALRSGGLAILAIRQIDLSLRPRERRS